MQQSFACFITCLCIFFIRKRKTLPRAKIMLITVIVNLVEIEGGHDIYGEMCHYY